MSSTTPSALAPVTVTPSRSLVLLAVVGLVFGVYRIVTALVQPTERDGGPWALAVGVGMVVYGVVVARMRVVASPDGLFVRNPLRSYRMAWSDVAAVEVVSARWTPLHGLPFLRPRRTVGQVQLQSGARIRMHATERIVRGYPDAYVATPENASDVQRLKAYCARMRGDRG